MLFLNSFCSKQDLHFIKIQPKKNQVKNGILLPKLFWLLWEKIVLVTEKNFSNSRLKAENLQKFWDH